MTAKKENPKKAGRKEKYHAEMCDIVVKMMKKGCSIAEVCDKLDICHDTFIAYQDPEKHPEFVEAVKKGLTSAKAKYERKGRVALFKGDPGFSWTGWYMQMKNRFGYSDKHETRDADAKKSHDDWVKEMSQ